ncbi:hypothetical protein RB595_008518 [Gaeumannomyces hyphopodioides]
MKFLKVGRVAIITRGRYAGKKVRKNACNIFCPQNSAWFLPTSTATILFPRCPRCPRNGPDERLRRWRRNASPWARLCGYEYQRSEQENQWPPQRDSGALGGAVDWATWGECPGQDEGTVADIWSFPPALQVVIIQPVDSGNKPHPYGHAIVAGIERYPSKITRRMSKTRQEKRSKIKPFVKLVNYNHLMPTRYTLELEGLKGTVTNDTFKEVSQREDAKKNVKKVLEERYTSGKNRWFFTPLRF